MNGNFEKISNQSSFEVMKFLIQGQMKGSTYLSKEIRLDNNDFAERYFINQARLKKKVFLRPGWLIIIKTDRLF